MRRGIVERNMQAPNFPPCLRLRSPARIAAMHKTLLAFLVAASLGYAIEYKAVPDWYSFPDGKKIIGNMHGDVAVSSNGEVYVSVMDPKAGLQVFAPDGKFLRIVPNA